MSLRTMAALVAAGWVVLACSSDPNEPPGSSGTGGGGAGGAGGEAGDGGSASLADELLGTWSLTSLSCAGELLPEAYDGFVTVLDFQGDALTVSLDKPSCILSISTDVVYDDDARSFAATAHGTIACLPSGCSDLCDQDAAVIPAPRGNVTIDGESLTLESADAEALAMLVCTGQGLAAPAVEAYRRGPPEYRIPFDPEDIDETVCEQIDPFADGRTVYYVAQSEPGADDAACDGLAPVDEGGGHCPFASLTSPKVRELLYVSPDGQGVRGITMVLRTGTYVIEPLPMNPPSPDLPPIPLRIHSDAASPEDAVVLMAAPGEIAVLDGTCPATTPTCDSPEDPGRIWQLVEAFGDWILVDGLTFDNAHKWNIGIHDRNVCVRDNELIGPYGSDSDSIKSGTSGPNVIVRGNDMHTGFEQALDGTGARGWLIEDNYVHDAPERGIGFKYGASGNVVRNNRFENLAGIAIALGGGSSAHTFPFESTNLVAQGNEVVSARGLVEIFSCEGCSVLDNSVTAVDVGVVAQSDEQPSGCPGGCALTSGLALSGNRFRELVGTPDPDPEVSVPPNLFAGLLSPAIEVTAGANLYCLAPGNGGLFVLGTETLSHEAWSAALGTDADSAVIQGTDGQCVGF